MTESGKPCVVYIVDDDDLVRKGLARVIRAGGLIPKVYASPILFLKEVGSEVPGCILLDITMPGMSGFEVQTQLHARGNTIPVIIMSAHGDDETRARAAALGAHYFLSKPVDERALLDAIASLVRNQQVISPAPYIRPIKNRISTINNTRPIAPLGK